MERCLIELKLSLIKGDLSGIDRNLGRYQIDCSWGGSYLIPRCLGLSYAGYSYIELGSASRATQAGYVRLSGSYLRSSGSCPVIIGRCNKLIAPSLCIAHLGLSSSDALYLGLACLIPGNLSLLHKPLPILDRPLGLRFGVDSCLRQIAGQFLKLLVLPVNSAVSVLGVA